MSKHTPEWKVFTDGDDNLCVVIMHGNYVDTWIAKIFDNDEAHAALIAAAPELLAALELIEDQAERAALVQDRSVGIIKQVCAVIAKDLQSAIEQAGEGEG